ncbi:2-amino-4-hydroxy-6-hydroxymethyldihydropteridinediphosphokinase [Devosia enhydra]|uniref:2-amino-4-hydroxy-6-hydroxymethyldihydropteridine pyrophosphokinase n=1 Tax=Devosia enhydra TaxID=665118 RepID=A0A1K2HUN8_9HYPH|nr:2-amino-4-hydroxy-6-hydroxymethyldihydropteridine diphosphokinase [Devosia enhydra]SFZ82220.1 2-amino-4-hydroxy-6-hydroxymethyldihydropteridinediphosphokinase [Devosia enhydra]
MSRAYLGLGANIGDPAAQLAEARRRIAALPGTAIVALSDEIATPAWGKTDQPDFLNQVVAIDTSLPPHRLLEACLEIEHVMGRVRIERWGPRLIDIDIIAYDRLVLADPRLTLPHPHAAARAFVIDPLRQVAPDIADWIAAQNRA